MYAESRVHRGGENLDAVIEYASIGRYGTALDLATGAGFTAFALAPYSQRVLATDIAPEMLAQTRRLAKERGLDEVAVALVEAEALPFATGSIDAVSCRQAAHHFYDLSRAVEEVCRVLKPGAPFILSDTAAPESEHLTAWMNDIEVRRDATHRRGLMPSEWLDLLSGVGLEVTHRRMAKVHLEFNDWVHRSATPQEDIEPLRRDFLSASDAAVTAFGIRPDGDAIHFYWDVLVVRAVKA